MLNVRIKVKTTRKRSPAKRLISRYKKEIQNSLKSIGQKGVNNIRHEIKKRDLIDTGNMSKSVRYKLLPKGVKFTIDSPAPFLEKGIRRHTMRYLLNSKGPIPLEDATTGNVIFRWATKKSMARGGWKHPGFKNGIGFATKAVQETRRNSIEDIRTISRKIF
jgi:hypothetical protein